MEDPFVSIRSCITSAPRRWSLHPSDAWLYGVVIGWNEKDLEELTVLHNWALADVSRLQRLHSAFESARKAARKHNPDFEQAVRTFDESIARLKGLELE